MTPKHFSRRTFVYSFVCLWLALSLSGLAQTPLPTATPKPLPRSDNQVWNETQILAPVSKRVELNFLQFARGGNNVSLRTDTRTGLGILIKINKYYSIQPTYVYQYAHPGEGRKAFSHRLYVDNLIKIPVKKVNLANRIRFERIVRHGRVDLWNLRFRPGIEIPLKFGEHSMTLYANNEIFYDTFYRAWTRNRFIVGISKKINSNFTIDTFYQHQNDAFARPGNLKVFGTTFKFKLHPKQ